MHLLDQHITQACFAALCFAISTLALKNGVISGDQRFTMAAFAMLSLGYVFYVRLMEGALSEAIVLTSMLSQIIALVLAFIWFDETFTINKAVGIILALGATLAFALPENPKA